MRFNMDIIHKTGAGYRAIITTENGSETETAGRNWEELRTATTSVAGLDIGKRKYYSFYKLSDFETVAGVDASHVRQSCMVTMQDRRNGWSRSTF